MPQTGSSGKHESGRSLSEQRSKHVWTTCRFTPNDSCSRDDRYVDSRFLAEAAQEFAEVSRRADISSLKEFLKSHVSVKPELWPSMPSEVRKQVRKWAEEVYMDGVYDYVLHLIDDIPEDSLRGFLKDLSRDPAIGEGLIRLSSVKRS